MTASLRRQPTSRQTLEALTCSGSLAPLVAAGARLHQSGCMGCIGVGQAPLRTRLERGEHTFTVRNLTRDATFQVRHDVSDRQVRVLVARGRINDFRAARPRVRPRRRGGP